MGLLTVSISLSKLGLIELEPPGVFSTRGVGANDRQDFMEDGYRVHLTHVGRLIHSWTLHVGRAWLHSFTVGRVVFIIAGRHYRCHLIDQI